jgi:hypothetical protein
MEPTTYLTELCKARDAMISAHREMTNAARAARKSDNPIKAEEYSTIADSINAKIEGIVSFVHAEMKRFGFDRFLY